VWGEPGEEVAWRQETARNHFQNFSLPDRMDQEKERDKKITVPLYKKRQKGPRGESDGLTTQTTKNGLRSQAGG